MHSSRASAITLTAADFDQIEMGQRAIVTESIDERMVEEFAILSGDVNPLHMSVEFAQSVGFPGRVVHGALLAAFVSRMLGNLLPGPGCLWTSQTFNWRRPTFIGDTIEITGQVKHKSLGTRTVLLDIQVKNQLGQLVMNGDGAVRMLKPSDGGSHNGNA